MAVAMDMDSGQRVDYYYMFGFGGIYNFISRRGDLLITVDGLDHLW